MEWQTIDTAPSDGTAFLALNDDGEMHVCKIDEIGRKLRRTHQQRWAQSFSIQDEKKILTDEQFSFDTYWSIWTKGYEFAPTHWTPIPILNPGPPPVD